MRKVYLRLFFHVKNHANLRLKYKNSEVLLRESVKNVRRKTLKEKYDAKIKAQSAKKGKK